MCSSCFSRGLSLAGADYRLGAEEDGAMVRIPPHVRHPALEFGVVARGLFNPWVDGKHGVGVFSREVNSPGRCPRLDQRGAVLRGADHV